MTRYEMILTLINAYDPVIRGEDLSVIGNQIMTWQLRVENSLEAAGMQVALKIWRDACETTNFWADPDSMAAHAETMKGVLIGILNSTEAAAFPETLIPIEIFDGQHSYLAKLAEQANGCFRNGWLDAGAVMIRRLVEILIIDAFEAHGLQSKIKSNDNYFGLAELIQAFLDEGSAGTWHVSRLLKRYLPQMKDLKAIGDIGAHGRSLVSKAHLSKMSESMKYVLEGLVEIAYR
jgi:hypothetical protein